MRKIIVGALIGVFIGSAFAATIAYSKAEMHGRFSGTLYVSGINISGKTPEEAILELNQKAESFLQKPISLQLDQDVRESTFENLGLEYSVEETVKTLEATDARSLNILETLFPSKEEKSLNIITKINYEQLESELEKLFKISEIEPRQAKFFFDQSYRLSIEEGQEGININEEKLVKSLRELGENFETQDLVLDFSVDPPLITKELLQKQEAEIREALRHQVALIDPVYTDDWYIRLTDHLDWVEFNYKQKAHFPHLDFESEINKPIEGVEGEKYVSISINKNKLDEFIDVEIAQWLDRPPENVKIYKNDDDQVIIEGKGHDGREIQRHVLKESLELAIENRIAELTIPVVEITPEFEISKELQDLGITERIAVGHTSYYGSPVNRVHNIKTGASKFNGKLIAPGEVFSFNQNLGAVNGATGYRKELVIKPEGTIPEYGGGICQVSTTLYRAILYSGLPITERHEHSYAVSYYSQVLGHGLDATIYLGGPDLKFQNDSDSHLLIQTYTENDYELYMVFYGEDQGRDVELEGPYISNHRNPGATQYIETTDLAPGQSKQVEKPHVGFQVLWYRHITDKEGNSTKEQIQTNYKAIPAKILVGKEEV